jgi:hypothetical protein
VLVVVCWLWREDDRGSERSCGAVGGDIVFVDEGGGAKELPEGVGDLAPKRFSNLSFWLIGCMASFSAVGGGGGGEALVGWLRGDEVLPNKAKRLSRLSFDVSN